MKTVINTYAELKKSVAYKKKRLIQIDIAVHAPDQKLAAYNKARNL